MVEIMPPLFCFIKYLKKCILNNTILKGPIDAKIGTILGFRTYKLMFPLIILTANYVNIINKN